MYDSLFYFLSLFLFIIYERICTGIFVSSYDYIDRVQMRIVKRAAELLTIGGRLVYSTCSLNPIENEAVMHRIIAESEGKVCQCEVQYPLPGKKPWLIYFSLPQVIHSTLKQTNILVRNLYQTNVLWFNERAKTPCNLIGYVWFRISLSQMWPVGTVLLIADLFSSSVNFSKQTDSVVFLKVKQLKHALY